MLLLTFEFMLNHNRGKHFIRDMVQQRVSWEQ